MSSLTLADLNSRTTMAEDAKKGRKWVRDDKPEADDKPAFAPKSSEARRATLYDRKKGK